MQNTNGLEKRHFGSLLELEERRARTLMIIGMIATLTWVLSFGQRFSIYKNPTTLWILLGITISFFVGELLLWLRIRYRLKRDYNFQDYRPYYLYLVSTLEISLPTLVLLLLSYTERDNFLFNSPAYTLYFVFIVLSALHLNLWLSIYTGALAGLQYVLVGFIIRNVLGLDDYGELEKLFLRDKGILLALGGVCAGFVGEEIRKQVVSSIHFLDERNRVERLLGQQVSHKVAQALLQDKDEGKEQDVTVMFMDVRNFTPFAERHSAQEVVAFQNALFSPMIEVINHNHGIVNQLLGDGLMATFGAPLPNESHALDAVKAGKEMLAELEKLVQKGTIPRVRLGIGLHSGVVVAGNIGNTIRKQYSLTGTTVILAARIEQLNKQFGSSFLISKDVYKQIVPYQEYFTSLGPVELKGRQEAIEIYTWQQDISGTSG